MTTKTYKTGGVFIPCEMFDTDTSTVSYSAFTVYETQGGDLQFCTPMSDNRINFCITDDARRQLIVALGGEVVETGEKVA